MRRPTVAVNAVIFNKDGKRVLLTQRRDNGIWCLPGGHVEVGETIASAIGRECSEEIGCEIRVDRLVGVYSAPNLKVVAPARLPMIVVAMTCTIVSGRPGASDEVIKSEYFPFIDLPELVPNQRERILHAAYLDEHGPRLL